MDTAPASPPPDTPPQPKWQPLSAVERRVIGVLVEKAKTTPAGYPMSLNAVVTGCNQKSNRHPTMNLTPEQVSDTLDALRAKGAAAEVHTGGRVPKYRHYMYEWLGVDKTEIAVVTELLLRGPQTIGELRGRAARMEPIASLAALQPILEALRAKRLLHELTPAGRGQIITHGLYPPAEWKKVRASAGAGTGSVAAASRTPDEPTSGPEEPATVRVENTTTASSTNEVAQLRSEVEELRAEVARLRKDLEDVWANLR